jgi:hypothetical protein
MSNHDEKPYLKKHQFNTDRVEPLTAKLTVRVTASMMDTLKSMQNYPEFVREAIQVALSKIDDGTDKEG